MNSVRPIERLKCAECGYDLRGRLPVASCPECGHFIGETLNRRLYPHADRRLAMIWTGYALLGMGALGVVVLILLADETPDAFILVLTVLNLACGVVFVKLGRKSVVVRRRGRCSACGYQLRGITSPRCPECGSWLGPSVRRGGAA